MITGEFVQNKPRVQLGDDEEAGENDDGDEDKGGDGGGPGRDRLDASPKGPTDSDDDEAAPAVKISRKEADKITVPSFPKILHIDNWKNYGGCAWSMW